jgi:hypothetical protein
LPANASAAVSFVASARSMSYSRSRRYAASPIWNGALTMVEARAPASAFMAIIRA